MHLHTVIPYKEESGMPQAGLMSSTQFNKRIVEITTQLGDVTRDGKGATLIDDAWRHWEK